MNTKTQQQCKSVKSKCWPDFRRTAAWECNLKLLSQNLSASQNSGSYKWRAQHYAKQNQHVYITASVYHSLVFLLAHYWCFQRQSSQLISWLWKSSGMATLVAGTSQHCGSNEQTSLKPNRSWIHGHMALNDGTTVPRRQSSVTFSSHVSSPRGVGVITAVVAGRGKGERRADWASQVLQHELKGPSHLELVHCSPI